MESEDKSRRGYFASLLHRGGNGSQRKAFAASAEWAESARRAMVERQLRRRGIRDERVLEAMGELPRHEFVPPELFSQAYEDHPLPIGGGQTISQPYMVAAMLEALELEGTERVLEVGTGSAYEAALLARLAAHVYTIECDAALARSAKERLDRMGLGVVVEVIEGDGSLGYPPAAPYDGILVAAAAPEIPPCLLEQLVEGGRLAIPVGDRDCQELRQIRKRQASPVVRHLGYCRFVPLLGAHGWEEI
ncbi:MAG: protein-L-isoaspartate(D-aspartate) O-methyltransferase [Terriglobia bacterium]